MSNEVVQTVEKSIDLGSLDFTEVPYTIGGIRYILSEADGEKACLYRNALLKNTELGPDGRPKKVGNMADTEPLLVSLCLRRADDSHRLNVNQIKKWPSRIIKILYTKAQEISLLSEETESRTQLEEALDLPGAPCDFRSLVEFIEALDEEVYGAIQTWMGDSSEIKAKNSPEGMEGGSG